MQTVEHLVIGAGVVGCSVAFHLAARGRAVQVVESGPHVAAGTSARGFGLIWAAGKSPASYLRLTLASQRYYPELLDAIGDRVDYVQDGGLLVLETTEKRDLLWSIVQPLLGTDGFRAELLDADEARKLEPRLSPAVAGAIFSPHEAHLTPTLLVRALAAAAERGGARFAFDSSVQALERDGEGWRVQTSQQTYRAAKVAICAGVWSRQIAALVGVDVPVFPDKGQVIQTAPQPPTIRYPGIDVRQAKDGRIWMGTIHAGDVGFDLSLRDDWSEQIRATARAQFPAIADLPAERTWAGLRPMPVDGLPILGALPDAPNLFIAVGHSAISLGAIEGKLMSELLGSGRSDPLMEPFGIGRFTAAAGGRDPSPGETAGLRE